MDALHNPLQNKGTAFSKEERGQLRVHGLLPGAVESLEQQVVRAKRQFDSYGQNIHKHSFLTLLHDTNTTLFYKFLETHLIESLPIVYTPTVGEACIKYSQLFRRPQGLFVSKTDKGHIRQVLDNWPLDPEMMVVSDGGRILGLGDLGLNGMGIPVGKLSLYVAAAGINPAKALPVMLDMGTNNEELLQDPLYLGLREHRPPDDEYFAVVDEFLMAVRAKWPKCLVQFEDFATPHAIRLLELYRHKLLCFNDDIQGTGSVILAGFLNALKIQGTDPAQVRCVFYGAGSAAIGTALTIVALLETLGLTNEQARRCFWMIDSKGLIVEGRGDQLAEHKKPFARPDPHIKSLTEVIRHVKPHVLMGLAAQGPSFTQEHIEIMMESVERPVVFPLSNPTSKAEITAVDAYTWSKGKCVFAAGSPFDPVTIEGTTYYPAQGNNMFIFPGVGLGAVACEAKEVTDLMFINAAKKLASLVGDDDLKAGRIYPDLSRLRLISGEVARVTIETAVEQKLTDMQLPVGDDLLRFCQDRMWAPEYVAQACL